MSAFGRGFLSTARAAGYGKVLRRRAMVSSDTKANWSTSTASCTRSWLDLFQKVCNSITERFALTTHAPIQPTWKWCLFQRTSDEQLRSGLPRFTRLHQLPELRKSVTARERE